MTPNTPHTANHAPTGLVETADRRAVASHPGRTGRAGVTGHQAESDLPIGRRIGRRRQPSPRRPPMPPVAGDSAPDHQPRPPDNNQTSSQNHNRHEDAIDGCGRGLNSKYAGCCEGAG
jgi:hypothetical protein